MAAQSWIVYSLLSALFLAVVNIVDKYVITNLVKKPLILVLIVAAMGLIPSLGDLRPPWLSRSARTKLCLGFPRRSRVPLDEPFLFSSRADRRDIPAGSALLHHAAFCIGLCVVVPG